MDIGRDGTVSRFFVSVSLVARVTLSRSVGIRCPAGFLSRDCPPEFCPGLDYPAALSPGPTSEIRVPGPGF